MKIPGNVRRLRRIAHKDPRRATLRAATSPEDRLGENRLPSVQDDATIQNLYFSNDYGDDRDVETWSLLHYYDFNCDLFLCTMTFSVVIDCAVSLPVTIIMYCYRFVNPTHTTIPMWPVLPIF